LSYGLLCQIVNNFVAQITSSALGSIGFVPNGGRVYYLNRSQPPLLSEMVVAVYNATRNKGFLEYVWFPETVRLQPPTCHVAVTRSAVSALDKEYTYWMNNGSYGNGVSLNVPGVGNVMLNRYATNWTQPRPESWLEDTNTVRVFRGLLSSHFLSSLVVASPTRPLLRGLTP
jgi:alpha,alpha-trehalase